MTKRETEHQKLTVTFDQLEMLRYRAAGWSLSQIAKKMHKSAPAISRSLDDIERVYADVRFIVTEIERYDLIRKAQEQKFKPSKGKEAAFMRAMEEKVRSGYFLGVVPMGYRKENGRLVQMTEATKIKQIFDEFDKAPDITLGQLARKFGMTHHRITYILRNPTYKGYIPYRGITFKGSHEPIVSEELWDRVQKRIADRRYGQRSLPEGYKYVEGQPVFDPQTAPKIKEMFKLKVAGSGFSEIGRRLKMDPSAVRERIKNPYYANKKFVKGKWVDDNHEAILDFENWKAANRPRSKEIWDEAVQLRRQVKTQNKNKILACLGTSEKTLGEIAKETGLSKATVHRQLLECQKQGLTEKNPPGKQKGKWRIRVN